MNKTPSPKHLFINTRKRLRLLAIVVAAFLSTSLSAQDTISADELVRRYRMYQAGKLTKDSITTDEVVCAEYSQRYKKKSNGRWTRFGGPYLHSLVNDLRTPEFPDKRHFWSFVGIRYYPLLGKRIRFRRRYNRAVDHGRRPRKRVRRYTYAPRPEFLSLDSIDGMKREEWEPKVSKSYITKFKHMDYAQGVTKELNLIDEPFFLLGIPVSLYHSQIEVKNGIIIDYGKATQKCIGDNGELHSMSVGTLSRTKKGGMSREMAALDKIVNAKIKASNSKKFVIFIKHLPDRKAVVEPLDAGVRSDPDFQQLAKALESVGDDFYPRLWTVNHAILPGLIIEAECSTDKGWVFTLPGDEK